MGNLSDKVRCSVDVQGTFTIYAESSWLQKQRYINEADSKEIAQYKRWYIGYKKICVYNLVITQEVLEMVMKGEVQDIAFINVWLEAGWSRALYGFHGNVNFSGIVADLLGLEDFMEGFLYTTNTTTRSISLDVKGSRQELRKLMKTVIMSCDKGRVNWRIAEGQMLLLCRICQYTKIFILVDCASQINVAMLVKSASNITCDQIILDQTKVQDLKKFALFNFLPNKIRIEPEKRLDVVEKLIFTRLQRMNHAEREKRTWIQFGIQSGHYITFLEDIILMI